MNDLSAQTRSARIKSLQSECFDVLVIGGGITGVATVLEANARGLKTALIEKNDFAFGTSSRSSKLAHGGLRYLEKLELGLVFEALHERTFLLKTASHLVKPMPFYFPVYEEDRIGKFKLSLGMWAYDLLSAFRTPGVHKSLSASEIHAAFSGVKTDGLLGGFRYYDASLFDDSYVLALARAAAREGSTLLNYVELISASKVNGIYKVEVNDHHSGERFQIQAKKIILCAGPWTDEVGKRIESDWKNRICPSKGIHLVFPLKKMSIPGTFVMSDQKDGRISFVMPRPDMGAGVLIIGTTDTDSSIDDRSVTQSDVDYLMGLFHQYFPNSSLTAKDMISSYAGVRPLVEETAQSHKGSSQLQGVSREHVIELSESGVVVVAGGKYTTHRVMAKDAVDLLIQEWKLEAIERGEACPIFQKAREVQVFGELFRDSSLNEAYEKAKNLKLTISDPLFYRFGADACVIAELDQIEIDSKKRPDPIEGFEYLAGLLRFAIRTSGLMSLKDFYLRRVPLFLADPDHGKSWVDYLAHVLVNEMNSQGLSGFDVQTEISSLSKVMNSTFNYANEV